MVNKVQLITYVDRLSGGDFAALQSLLDGPLEDLFGGIHILPFFEAIDGEDAGFDPIDHMVVDTQLGDWRDVQHLSARYDVMADLIINHVSSDSPQFADYMDKGDHSRYAGMFLRFSDIFPDGAREQDLLSIYRPRPGLPFTRVHVPQKGGELLWTTFTSKQIDINLFHPEGEKYLNGIIERFSDSGVKIIRLDAIGYAVKSAGSSCFMIPETYAYINTLVKHVRSAGLEVLVEIHSHYQRQIEIARHVDWVYDFALAPLALHALFNADALPLRHWLKISPTNCITVLDTHDGIGIVDVASQGTHPGLLNETQINDLIQQIHTNSSGQSQKSTGTAANNLDIYQINCTFYSALGKDDNDYLLARLIQFICPGIPQVYYVGLLAGTNDMALLERSRVGRDINRHHYTPEEVCREMKRGVVQKLCALIRFRNSHPAFAGVFSILESSADILGVSWSTADARLDIFIDLSAHTFSITSRVADEEETFKSWDDLTGFTYPTIHREPKQKVQSR